MGEELSDLARKLRVEFQPFFILQDIYCSEVNWQLSTFWDEGVYAKLGDKVNGWKAESKGIGTVEEAILWLKEQTIKHYPESDFAKMWRKINEWSHLLEESD